MAKRKRKQPDLWALDTEDDSKGNPYLFNFYNGTEHFTFDDRDEALDWFKEAAKSPMEIWATNTCYDLINLFGTDVTNLQINFVGSRFISAKMPGTKVRFKDTLNHWKISVEKMGERIGLRKLKVNGNFNDVKYCQRDTEITWKFVKLQKEYYESFGAKLKSTIGSTALDFYQNNFSHFKRDNPFSNEQLEFMKLGYYGGRTEIFFNKALTGNIQYVDYNSLYPSTMLGEFPVIRPGQFKFTKKPNIKQNEGIAHVRIFAPTDLVIPYLPYRSATTKSLLFPVGRFSGHYTYFELREAEKIGYKIEKIYNAFEFRAGNHRPFKTFVETLYEKRMKAKKAGDEMLSDSFKLIMNNLYGKFGQGNDKEELVPYHSKTKLQSGDQILGTCVLRKTKGEYPAHTNMIWSAYVTAYGRHKLWEGMEHVRRSDGLLIYCDTDSIIFEHPRTLFSDSADLGGLKLEGLFKYAHFKLPKLYSLVSQDETKKYRAKGVPQKVAGEFFEKGRASFQRPYKLRETLRRNLSPKRTLKLIPNYWDEVTKQTHKKYDKRKVLRTGHTKPLEIA